MCRDEYWKVGFLLKIAEIKLRESKSDLESIAKIFDSETWARYSGLWDQRTLFSANRPNIFELKGLVDG